MKITDKTEEKSVDPVVHCGDIIKREYDSLYGERTAEYFIVARRGNDSGDGNILIDLYDGRKYPGNSIQEDSTLQFYQIFFGQFEDTKITHIPADQAELVIGG